MFVQYLGEVLQAYAPAHVDVEEYMLREHEGLVMIQAWRTLLVVAASTNVSLDFHISESCILNLLILWKYIL